MLLVYLSIRNLRGVGAYLLYISKLELPLTLRGRWINQITLFSFWLSKGHICNISEMTFEFKLSSNVKENNELHQKTL